MIPSISVMMMLMAGCTGKTMTVKPIDSTATQRQAKQNQSLPTLASWTGRIHVKSSKAVDNADSPVRLHIIRNQAELAAFVDNIPIREIQKRKPAPISKDPFIQGVDINFEHEILVVITRNDSMYVHARIQSLSKIKDKGVVHYQLEDIGESKHYAAMMGVGTYHAVKTTRVDNPFTMERQ